MTKRKAIVFTRRGRFEDLPEVAQIYCEAFANHTRGKLGKATCQRYFYQVLQDKAYCLLVATDNREVQGFAVLHIDLTIPLGLKWLVRSWGAIILLIAREPLFVSNRLRQVLKSFIERKLFRSAGADPGAVGARNERLTTSERSGWLDTLAVKKSARRLGIGSMMIRSSLALTKKKSLSYLKLTVESSNRAAIQAYESLGFACLKGTRNEIIYYRSCRAPIA